MAVPDKSRFSGKTCEAEIFGPIRHFPKFVMGNRKCRRPAVQGGRLCWQHGGVPEMPPASVVQIYQLPFATSENWRWRWVQRPTLHARALHRVLRHARVDEAWAEIHSVETVCGLSWERGGMPGLPSRSGAPRCKTCCRLLGIPPGNGAPFNCEIDEPSEVSLEGPDGRA